MFVFVDVQIVSGCYGFKPLYRWSWLAYPYELLIRVCRSIVGINKHYKSAQSFASGKTPGKSNMGYLGFDYLSRTILRLNV